MAVRHRILMHVQARAALACLADALRRRRNSPFALRGTRMRNGSLRDLPGVLGEVSRRRVTRPARPVMATLPRPNVISARHVNRASVWVKSPVERKGGPWP